MHIALCNQSPDYSGGNAESHTICYCVRRYTVCENLLFQYCNHVIDCSVQCVIGTINSETPVLCGRTELHGSLTTQGTVKIVKCLTTIHAATDYGCLLQKPSTSVLFYVHVPNDLRNRAQILPTHRLSGATHLGGFSTVLYCLKSCMSCCMSARVLGKLRSESWPIVTSIHCNRFVQSVSYSTFMFSVSITCPRSCEGEEVRVG